jgi:exopolyphosphatase/pppGpp-phosphohydrolase
MNKPFWRITSIRCALVLLFGFLPEAAGQLSEGGDQLECRAGFDVGSSGIRLGSNSGEANEAESRPINYLADLNENNDRFKVTTIDKTVGWFQVLRAETELPSDCKTVAGGFSAWRRAVQDGDRGEVADVLADIHHRTGVALYVIPPEEEGKYAYRAAQAALDEQLTTQAIWISAAVACRSPRKTRLAEAP